MRNVINISLPDNMVKIVKKEIKKGNYSSISEFFRHLLRVYNEENLILDELKKSRKEAFSGKGKILNSLKELR